MQIQVFAISLYASEAEMEVVNKFLRSHRVMTVDRHFSAENGGYWAIFVTYQENGSPEAPQPVIRGQKKDYREILSEEQFDLFARMRDLRRTLARQENKPAYAIFTDEELASIVQLPEITVSAIGKIKRIGQRATQYGDMFVQLIHEAVQYEKSGKSDAADSGHGELA